MVYKLEGREAWGVFRPNKQEERSRIQPTRYLPSHHIVEEAGGLDRLAEVLPPTEESYAALRTDPGDRHPRADPRVLDRLLTLEAFLDKGILAGFSYGRDKAEVPVTEGKLLGHKIGRWGSRADGERVLAVPDFAPLKEKVSRSWDVQIG